MQATYTHDTLGRLTQVTFDNGTQVIYNFDSVGNRTSIVRTGSLAAGTGDPSLCQVRVSLTQGDPWGLTDVTNGTTLYIEPIYDKLVGIWNGSQSYSMKANAFGLSLSNLAVGLYRVYVFDGDDDGIIESASLVAWTNNTTPPALDTLVADGYYVNSQGTNRRAIADILIHATGQCDWRNARRGICHLDERVRRPARLQASISDNSWTVTRTTTTWRRVANGATLGDHYVEFILSARNLVSAEGIVFVDRGAGGAGTYKYQLGFGLDVTNADSSTQPFGFDQGIDAGNLTGYALSKYKTYVAAGKHTLNIIEQNITGRDVTAYGDNNDVVFKSGMLAEIML
jgi:YD repeat-containing protein